KFLYDEQKIAGEEIASQTGVCRSTVYRVINEMKKLIL
ncbi:winged helix-turn-helix domain-containing protein, partial [Staphylococcus aureus]